MGIFSKSNASKAKASKEGPSEQASAKPDGKRANAFERAKQTRMLQEQALAALPKNSLHIVLFLRGDPPQPNDFHWGFYYHQDTSGRKYHVRQINTSWIADHADTAGLFKSNFLCVVIQVGSIPASSFPALDQAMKQYDGSLNSMPGITCRVWVLSVVQKLLAMGLVRCPSGIGALEQECFAIGNSFAGAAVKNVQPRPSATSRLCQL